MLLVVAFAVVLSAIIRATLVDVFYIPSNSMEPLLMEGDRVLVSRTDSVSGEIRRGDVVVFDGRGSFAPIDDGGSTVNDILGTLGQWLGVAGSDTVYVKRVIGIGGDVVRCCAEPGGPVTVNGNPLEEPYVFPTDAPSETRFEVQVPQGKLWMMGDHRSASFDSRSLLGAPGGGLVSTDRVIGRALFILWPPDRAGHIPRPDNPENTAAHPPGTQGRGHNTW